MSDEIKPPAHIAVYLDVLGLDLTVEFLLHFGGTELYIPVNSKGRGELVALVGDERAAALAERIDRLPSRVPTGKPWLAEVFQSRGLSVVQIARRLHVTDVAVRRWFRQAEAERQRQAQRSLF
ncbi:helix-turn-helix domain-containing protein [Paenirhodobacter enshiensis]|uniref:helix-turn-helix domain-containing protein n=1 Tax=Paenirhodobacter enshiensis TaxID=1105367 RepID=UPI003FA21A19